mgnify:CR=1 FL=1
MATRAVTACTSTDEATASNSIFPKRSCASCAYRAIISGEICVGRSLICRRKLIQVTMSAEELEVPELIGILPRTTQSNPDEKV